MADTSIEWTERSWNPIVGCSVVSPGCTNCYAMAIAERFKHAYVGRPFAGAPAEAMTRKVNGKAVWTGQLTLAPERTLLEPLRRRKPTTFFVNSMGDLFHEAVPDEWIDRVFAVMALTPHHTYQVLTKRSARMREYVEGHRSTVPYLGRKPLERIHLEAAGHIEGDGGYMDALKAAGNVYSLYLDAPWPLPNVWLGVSAEDQRRADERIPDLLATPAATRFVSAEPLLGPIDLRAVSPNGVQAIDALSGLSRTPDCDFRAKLDWIIVGGESGPEARPMHPDWARQIRDQCAAAGTAFFFKQWGAWLPCGDWYADHPVSLPIRAWTGSAWDDRPELVAPDTEWVARVGKKRAGRLLDGVQHDAMPEVRR